MYVSDTIAAIATPPGIGAIGIVRVSGPLARKIAERVFSTSHCRWHSHRLYHGKVLGEEGRPLDDGLGVLMRAPHTYTGEDVLEIHCHGSPVGLRRTLVSVLAQGARPAEPGEFTRRAFLNGRIDLTQAEAVIELIRAHTESGASLAAEQLFGRLSHQLGELRVHLIDIRARIEAQIDFSDEDLTIDQEVVVELLLRSLDEIDSLLASYGRGKVARDGLRVPITGKPNVGKSSLFNALLNENRAIVTAVPGTTRDVLEEMADFSGVPVLLSDAAGVRKPIDAVEEIGVGRAQAEVEHGHVVLVVFDGSRPLQAEDDAIIAWLKGRCLVAALNKSDLQPAQTLQSVVDAEDLSKKLSGAKVVLTSALQSSGLKELRSAVLAAAGVDTGPGGVHTGTGSTEPTIMLDRHRDALQKAAASLKLALAGAQQGLAPELLAVDVQAATDHIAGITGMVTTDDVLDRIFSEFCIGK